MSGSEEGGLSVTTESVNDRQVGGKHYKSSYQHWDFVYDVGFDYYEGCATKYLTRRKGSRKEDLEKAVHFLQKRMTLPAAPERGGVVPLDRFATANSLTYTEFRIIAHILDRDYGGAIQRIMQVIKDGDY